MIDIVLLRYKYLRRVSTKSTRVLCSCSVYTNSWCIRIPQRKTSDCVSSQSRVCTGPRGGGRRELNIAIGARPGGFAFFCDIHRAPDGYARGAPSRVQAAYRPEVHTKTVIPQFFYLDLTGAHKTQPISNGAGTQVTTRINTSTSTAPYPECARHSRRLRAPAGQSRPTHA